MIDDEAFTPREWDIYHKGYDDGREGSGIGLSILLAVAGLLGFGLGWLLNLH